MKSLFPHPTAFVVTKHVLEVTILSIFTIILGLVYFGHEGYFQIWKTYYNRIDTIFIRGLMAEYALWFAAGKVLDNGIFFLTLGPSIASLRALIGQGIIFELTRPKALIASLLIAPYFWMVAPVVKPSCIFPYFQMYWRGMTHVGSYMYPDLIESLYDGTFIFDFILLYGCRWLAFRLFENATSPRLQPKHYR